VTIVRQVTVVVIEMRLIDEGSTMDWGNLDSIEMTGTVEFGVISISIRSMDGWSMVMWSHPLNRVGLFYLHICGLDICGLLHKETHLDFILSRHQ